MGIMYGIGVGPGDPELLTIKAHRILNEVDIIFCPEKEEGAGSFAYDIVKGHLGNSKAEIVSLVYPMHYHGMKLREMWEQNAQKVASYLTGGRSGAFITLGDPSVYSTFMYTLPYIEKAGVTVEVVPGIPSFCAVAGRMKMPLASWNEDLIIAPVRKNGSDELGEILGGHDNIVLMKPSSNRKDLIKAIRDHQLEDSFVLVTKSGTGEERIVTDIYELERYDIPYLSTVIIKKRELYDQ